MPRAGRVAGGDPGWAGGLPAPPPGPPLACWGRACPALVGAACWPEVQTDGFVQGVDAALGAAAGTRAGWGVGGGVVLQA